jgi:hypothetical protein
MTGHCRDCRWWEEIGGFGYGSSDERPRARMLSEYSRWTWEAVHPASKALAISDTEDTTAFLHTAADFGCVQFEAKQ